jgi:4-hydroxythreonine-4-phosphate dehydrogenase
MALLLTTGEPAGIGPDLALNLASAPAAARYPFIALGDIEVLRTRAQMLGLSLSLVPVDGPDAIIERAPGRLPVWHFPVHRAVQPGRLDPANAVAVTRMLAAAAESCRPGTHAMVTAPVHKGVINDAGIAFTGHTEFLRDCAGVARTVMLLVAGSLRVALATTHLPLRDVSDAITREGLAQTLHILDHDLRARFGLTPPRIVVCGLNPHAGEGGHLGVEELEVIAPVIEQLRRDGMALRGPVPADTAFTPRALTDVDAVLSMFHDQGLPVLKHAGFGEAVNVTLGLPFVRTSVDHGTALELAGTGKAEPGSLLAALQLASRLNDLT